MENLFWKMNIYTRFYMYVCRFRIYDVDNTLQTSIFHQAYCYIYRPVNYFFCEHLFYLVFLIMFSYTLLCKMTYHNLSAMGSNSTGIFRTEDQTPFEMGMISWAELTTFILGILIIMIEFAQVIVLF